MLSAQIYTSFSKWSFTIEIGAMRGIKFGSNKYCLIGTGFNGLGEGRRELFLNMLRLAWI